MNILESIGNTPLIELKNINKNKNVKILVKLEGNNPGGSIKDRPALFMINKAESDKVLNKNKIIIEPTSGNTRIALAMIAAIKGYKIKLCIPECVSIERRHILEAFGAEIILTPGCEGTDGAIRKAFVLLKNDPEKYYMPNQFENPNNSLSHYETTGPEIFKQTEGRLDYFTTGMGTTGTLMGIGKYLKEKNNEIQIIGIEPVMGHTIQGLKNMQEAIVPKIYNSNFLDDKYTVTDEEAFNTARRLALEEGIFAGMSSGASVAGALKIAAKIKKGIITAVLPDRGDRYLSTNLFRSICGKCPP